MSEESNLFGQKGSNINLPEDPYANGHVKEDKILPNSRIYVII